MEAIRVKTSDGTLYGNKIERPYSIQGHIAPRFKGGTGQVITVTAPGLHSLPGEFRSLVFDMPVGGSIEIEAA